MYFERIYLGTILMYLGYILIYLAYEIICSLNKFCHRNERFLENKTLIYRKNAKFKKNCLQKRPRVN